MFPNILKHVIWLSSSLTSRKWDKDRIRSTMYGKFGAYRPKHYGVEYRTLSNTWVDHEDRRRFVFNAAQSSMEELMRGIRIYDNYYIPDFDYYVEKGSFGDILYYAKQILRNRPNNLYSNWLNIPDIQTSNPFDKKEEDGYAKAAQFIAGLGNAIPMPEAAIQGWQADDDIIDEMNDFDDDDIELEA